MKIFQDLFLKELPDILDTELHIIKGLPKMGKFAPRLAEESYTISFESEWPCEERRKWHRTNVRPPWGS